ncbi:hypothetical protein VTJ49DRAFT_1459 [Mycothermus thermophilus]|uniref:Uncharacterized protein n=1 Tax=Humicola insolens TaxID=85995 RepID=A0ABR3VCA2_HUMIN
MAHKSPIPKLQHSYALSPVTALAFLSDKNPLDPEPRILLLAGEDVWLKIFDVQTSRLVGQLKVFDSQPIHGICLGTEQQQPRGGGGVGEHDNDSTATTDVLLWGGHSVALLPGASLRALVQGETPPPRPVECRAPDWVYDGLLLPRGPGKETCGVIVTAHNEIIPLFTSGESNSSSSSNIAFGPPTSPCRPVLYSAHLSLDTSPEDHDATTVLVAAGTVFGEIIVWKWRRRRCGTSSSDQENYSCEVLHVLTGHEGSVFGVCVAPEPVEVMPGVVVRLLLSCSDDRTVRVWNVSTAGETQQPRSRWSRGDGRVEQAGEAGLSLDGPRETGFGRDNVAETGEGNQGDSARCVAMAMGHVSRIWHVKVGRILPGSGGRIEIFSFGEDGSRQRWDLDVADLKRWAARTDRREPGTLRHCDASTCHTGKNIWSAAVLDRGAEVEPLVATGGADGRIVISGRTRTQRGSASAGGGVYEDLNLGLMFDDVLRSLNAGSNGVAPKPGNTKSAFQRFAYLSDTVLAATASGRLFLATMGEPLVWEEVALPDDVVADLRPYNVIKSPARDMAVLGSATGRIYLFRRGHGIREVANVGAKVSDIVLLDASDTAMYEGPWTILANILGSDHAVLLHFDPSTGDCTMDPCKVKLPEQYIVTAAGFIDSTLILGSRTGSLTAYSRDSATRDFIIAAFRKDCKTKDAITCIVPIPESTSCFLTTCRDGRYRIYNLSDTPHLRLDLQHEISPPLNTLEAAFFTTAPDASLSDNMSHQNHQSHHQHRHRSHLILHGFRGPNFVVYDDLDRSVLSSTPCGGAHRPFATVSRLHDPGQTRFVFSKAGTLRVVSQSAAAERILRSGGHGREIKAPAACQFAAKVENQEVDTGGDGGNDDVLVATAAEDTTIRIWRHHNPKNYATDTLSNPSPPSLEPLAILEGHAAGIQTLRFFRHSHTAKLGQPPMQYLLSSAGSEELFVWRISRVGSAAYDALAVVREAVWEREEWDEDEDGKKEGRRPRQAHGQGPPPGKDLRIVDFDVASWNRQPSERGETVDGDGNGEILVTMVLSDSTVRSYIYTPPSADGKASTLARHGSGSGFVAGDSSPSPPPSSSSHPAIPIGGCFRPLARGRYTGACPFQVRHLHVDPRCGTVHALVAYTDGHVGVWEVGSGVGGEEETNKTAPVTFRLALVVRLHQSSIKSLDLQPSPSSPVFAAGTASRRWLIATGGDDNALCFLDLARQRCGDDGENETGQRHGKYVVLARYRVRSAHAAAITGLCLLPGHAAGERGGDEQPETTAGTTTHLATVSNDQRVKLWRIERRRSLGSDDGDSSPNIRVALLDNRYCSVADAGDMTVVPSGAGLTTTTTLMVGGVGVEMWDVTTTS